MAGVNTVSLLPRLVLDEVHRRLRRREPGRAIAQWLRAEGYRISASAVYRYARPWRERQGELLDLLDTAAMARESDVDLRDLAADLAAAAAVKAAGAAERALTLLADDDNEELAKFSRMADAALARAERLARLVRGMETGTAAGQARRDDRERRGDGAGGEVGMGDEALRRARAMAGLAPAPEGEAWDDSAYGLDEAPAADSAGNQAPEGDT